MSAYTCKHGISSDDCFVCQNEAANHAMSGERAQEIRRAVAATLLAIDERASTEWAVGFFSLVHEHSGDCSKATNRGSWTCPLCQRDEYFLRADAMIQAFLRLTAEPSEGMCRAYFEASAKAAREDFNVNPGTWEGLSESQRERLRSFGRAAMARLTEEMQNGST